MSQTVTPRALLIVAAQDLFDAEQAWIERLPALASRSGDWLTGFVEGERRRAVVQAERLEKIVRQHGKKPAGAANIWLRAILDDAERDTEMIAAGSLRDIALIGAFRKGRQSERVSYETAIGLARICGDRQAEAALTLSHDEEAEADRMLEALLARLFQSIV